MTATKTGIERNETVFAAPFVRGLSVLDALFHLGFDGTAALFAQSRPETAP